MPFCWNGDYNMIKELHMCLRLQNKKLLKFISNNKADNDYFNLGASHHRLPIETTIIPSLCLYTQMKWNTDNHTNKFLLYNGNLPNMDDNIIHRSTLGRYKWGKLMCFRGIIHLPYEASTMSIFEHISSNIPLFFPSKNLIKNATNYWSKNNTCMPQYLHNIIDLMFWINNADYYNIEGYYYFDSFEHLKIMLTDFIDDLYEVRKKFLIKRKTNTLLKYKKVFNI